MSFGMLKLDELGAVRFGIMKLGEFRKVNSGIFKLGKLGELWTVEIRRI